MHIFESLLDILEESLHHDLSAQPEIVKNTIHLYDKCLYQGL